MNAERKALRAAIDAHHAALEVVAKTEEALARAKEFADELSMKLAEFDDLDERVAATRAATLKAAFAIGEAPRLDAEPEGFARDRIRRDRLASDLAACKASIEIMERDLCRAQDDAARRDLAREHAVERVVAKMAEQAAVDFMGRLADLRRLSYLLNAVVTRQVKREPGSPGMTPSIPGAIYGSGPYRHLELPEIVHRSAREHVLGDFEQRHGFGLRKETAAAVADLWERLKIDAEAMLDDPPEPPADTVVPLAARRRA